MQLLLNKDQATAVANAMCELNNVFSRITVDVDGMLICNDATGSVTIRQHDDESTAEAYLSQNDFMAAYGV